jgi:excisionase family DNA binding protein
MANLLTTQEAAERLGVTASRIRQMVLVGILPAEKRGRDLFIDEMNLSLVKDRPKVGRPPKPKDEKASKASKRKGKTT